MKLQITETVWDCDDSVTQTKEVVDVGIRGTIEDLIVQYHSINDGGVGFDVDDEAQMREHMASGEWFGGQWIQKNVNYMIFDSDVTKTEFVRILR